MIIQTFLVQTVMDDGELTAENIHEMISGNADETTVSEVSRTYTQED